MANTAHSKVIYLDRHRLSGQESLLTRTVKEHEVALMRFLRVRLHNESEREDIAQEVFLRLCQQRDLDVRLSQGLEATRSYLFTIATNLIRDMRRRQAVRHSGDHESLDENDMLDDQQSPEALLQTRQHINVIKEVLQQLPPNCRKAFALSRFKSMSYREIAEKLGVSSSSVEKYISHALVEIRKRVEVS